MLQLEAEKSLRFESFGEDTCELVETIEQSFGMKFTEDELFHARTLGAMAEMIFKKLEQPVTAQCLTAITFYRLRQAFIELFGTPRRKVSPATSLYELMPWKTRKKQWRNIQDYLNYVLPQLFWPSWLLGIALVLTGSALYFLFSFKMLSAMGSISGLIGVFAFIAVLAVACMVLNPLARQFPRGCATFGDLTRLLLARNYGKVVGRHGLSPRKEVIQSLLVVVAEETATAVERLSSDTRFPEDLGIY